MTARRGARDGRMVSMTEAKQGDTMRSVNVVLQRTARQPYATVMKPRQGYVTYSRTICSSFSSFHPACSEDWSRKSQELFIPPYTTYL